MPLRQGSLAEGKARPYKRNGKSERSVNMGGGILMPSELRVRGPLSGNKERRRGQLVWFGLPMEAESCQVLPILS